jgi:hypothetical protein
MTSHAEVVAWRCQICGRDFSADAGGLCSSCERPTCAMCWGDRPAFLPTRQPQRKCKPCVAKNSGEDVQCGTIAPRSRTTYLMTAIGAAALGLSSRRYPAVLPRLLATYAGDTLWALMVFLGIGMLFPRWSTLRVCVAAWVFAFAIESSQLYHSPLVDQIRHTETGRLIFGYGFLWSDLLCYVVGIALGCTLEVLVTGPNARRRHFRPAT